MNIRGTFQIRRIKDPYNPDKILDFVVFEYDDIYMRQNIKDNNLIECFSKIAEKIQERNQ